MGDNAKRRRIQIVDGDDDIIEGPARVMNDDSIRRIEDEDDDNISNPDEYLDDEVESEGEGEDLMGENWLDDYAPAPELDRYDSSLLARDDNIVETYSQRMQYIRKAEEAMDQRELLEAKRRADADYRDEELEKDKSGDEEPDDLDEESDDDDHVDGRRPVNLEIFDVPLRTWISDDKTREEIKTRFRKFLRTFYPNMGEIEQQIRIENEIPIDKKPANFKATKKGIPIYIPKIRTMCSLNSSSLEVSYGDLGVMQSLLAIWLTDLPSIMLDIFDEVLTEEVKGMFPYYSQISQDLHVRIINLPLADRIRDLRQKDLNNLVKVSGVVTKRSNVFPMIKSVAWECNTCNAIINTIVEGKGQGDVIKPAMCIACQGTIFKTNLQLSEYCNLQRITLQESPGSTPAGRIPRYKEIILLGDLIDIARPGEMIEVTGIFKHAKQNINRDKSGFPVFSTIIEANCIHKLTGGASSDITEADKREIIALSKDQFIKEKIIRSIAPSIYGYRHVKTAIALSLFGGCAKDGGGSGAHRVRGDINILLLGDPGTAKSQFLKYAEKVAPRSIYTTGKGASAVGLTAGVSKDHTTNEWILEAGALVLADQGVCLIDEFDKMNEQDRTSIHEAMEQQTISVSKAGIIASLQARCAVIAAANPIGGRYDPSYTLAENVELTDPILQRFDILCVLQDTVDPVIDEQLALFVVNSHMRSHPEFSSNLMYADGQLVQDGGFDRELGDSYDNEPQDNDNFKRHEDDKELNPIDQELLKKYIAYAKANTRPILHDVDSEKISSLYADLRRQSALSGGVPIAVRHIESIMRMAEASARMSLRDHVRDDDIDLAIKVVLESFLQAQKISARRALQRSFRKYITYGEDNNQLLLFKLNELVNLQNKYLVSLYDSKSKPRPSNSIEIFKSDFEQKAKELNIFDLRSFIKSNVFRKHGFRMSRNKDSTEIIIKDF